MRRLATAGILLALILSGCASPVPGADGDLGNGWPAVAEVQQFVPDVGICHDDKEPIVSIHGYSAVDCAEQHLLETILVGEFTGPTADRGTLPTPFSKDMVSAFKVCDAEATKFVGRQWRDLRLKVTVGIPTRPAWAGGARWFRCDLREVPKFHHTTSSERPRTGTLKAVKDKELLVTCLRYDDEGEAEINDAVDCSKAHNTEYVGSIIAPADFKYPKKPADWDRLHDKCWPLADKFLGAEAAFFTGLISWPPSEEEWTGGDRGIRCFIWLGKGAMKRSAKGTKGIGVNFRN